MAGKLPCIPGELPSLNDWENHLTTLFPEVDCRKLMTFFSFCASYAFASKQMLLFFIQVRLKRYLEMRGADGGPWRRLCALPAFWVTS